MMKSNLPSAITASLLIALAADVHAQRPPHSPVPVPPVPASLLPGQTAPQVTDIWVVFKTHCDLGYTMSVESVNEKYRVPMMDNAIRLMEADRAKPAEERFKWTIAGWPMAENILGPKQDPARKAKIEQGLREGAFAVHALPATLHTDSFDPEDLVRGLDFSSRIARTYGHPLPVSAKMTDVPGHAWILPTLLHHAGVDFLQIGANYSVRPVLVPHLFWWEGPDGSRVLCNYTPNYGSTLAPPKDWPTRNYLAVLMTHDNEGPPSPVQVAAVRDYVAKLPGVKLHFSTMDEFAKAVLAENPQLPVVRGDMVDTWIHGLGSMPAESKTIRNARPLLPALDLLDTQLRLWKLTPKPLAADLAKAYEQSMLYGEHTWGANTPGWGFWSDNGTDRGTERFLYGDAFLQARSQGFYTKFESSFNDHRAYANNTQAIANRDLDERLSLLAQNVRQDGERTVVFNPLPWKRSGFVEVNGESTFVKDVPASGYVTLKNQSDRFDKSNLPQPTFETTYFKVTLDLKRGGISSLVEKSTGRELLDTTSTHTLGQFLVERFSEAQTWDYYDHYNTMNNAAWGTVKPNMPKDAVYHTLTPTDWQASIRHNENQDMITLTAGNTLGLAKAVTLTFTFPAYQPSLDTEWSIDAKTPTTIPEGGWLCFPFAVKDPQFLLGRAGGITDFAKDLIPGGNRHLFGIQSGVAVTSPDGGASLCALDAPCISLGEPGLWKYTFDYTPPNASLYVNLYNNMWNTNFPTWIEGSWTSRVRIWPVAANTHPKLDLITKSWEARCPLLAASASGKGGDLSASQSGLTLSRKGVLVTAFGGNPDGKYTLLRVWEQAGESGDLTVTLPPGSCFTAARPVNLRGEPEGEVIPINNQTLRFPLKGNAPASFLLK